MKKLLVLATVFLIITCIATAQCKPVSLADLKKWYATPDSNKDRLFTQQGYSKGKMIIDPEFGTTYVFLACWKEFKDGYAHHEQNLTWIPQYKILNFTTINTDNFATLRNEIKKTAVFSGKDNQNIETYKDALYGYSVQTVTTTEPMQQKHPSYVFLIYKAF